MSNMPFLAPVNAIKTKVQRWCGIVSMERLPEVQMEGKRGGVEVEDIDQLSNDVGPKPPNWCAEQE